MQALHSFSLDVCCELRLCSSNTVGRMQPETDKSEGRQEKISLKRLNLRFSVNAGAQWKASDIWVGEVLGHVKVRIAIVGSRSMPISTLRANGKIWGILGRTPYLVSQILLIKRRESTDIQLPKDSRHLLIRKPQTTNRCCTSSRLFQVHVYCPSLFSTPLLLNSFFCLLASKFSFALFPMLEIRSVAVIGCLVWLRLDPSPERSELLRGMEILQCVALPPSLVWRALLMRFVSAAQNERNSCRPLRSFPDVRAVASGALNAISIDA